MLAIPGFSLPGFFLHPADCPSLRTGKGRKRGFDKRESLGRERGRFGGGEGTLLEKGSLSPSNLSYCNNLPSASLTRAGLALPFILRMTCPTKKLMSLVLPPL